MNIRTVKYFFMVILFLLVFHHCTKILPEDLQPDEPEKNQESGEEEDNRIEKWDVWSNGTRLRSANIYQRRVYQKLDGSGFMGPGNTQRTGYQH